ncbi:MAG: NAD(P)-dependent oxidoreductase [Chloroflexota bacterium]|nr:NAD(P)-dependent oxidoreductase [Chloroflexota bacterium]
MKVAVTGAGGFIGRHVVAQLERHGNPLTLVLRPGSKASDTQSRHQWVQMDIANPPPDSYDRMGEPEALIHLAWGGLPNYASPHHLEQELPAQRSFLEGLLAAGLGSLTVTGTCLEYGMQSGALREDMPTAPVTAYGQAKDELRMRLEQLRRDRAFNLTWARLFYLHGEGQAPGSLLPLLEAAIARGDAAFDMSGGEQQRDYLPVEEAAHYLVELALNGMDNGVVNVCSGRPISVRELAESLVAKRGSPIRLNLGRVPYPDYEPMVFWGDRSKLDRCLDSTHEAIR